MKEVREYIEKSTWRINENANTNYSLSGLKSYLANTFLARDCIANMPQSARQYHQNGAIHAHDLDSGFGPYCLGADLLKLLQNGIKTPGVTTHPAKHLDVFLDHIVNLTYMYTKEWNGAIAWRDLDVLAAPFIRNDHLDYDDVVQNIQRLVFNLSFPLRSADQNPFSNLTLALQPPSYYENMNVIIGGKLRQDTYSDYQDEIDLFNIAFCDVMLKGDAEGKPHTFPLPTYNITKDFDWNSEVADKIFELTAKWGTPYFASYIGQSNFSVEDSISMCCRLRLNTDEIQRVSGGTWNYGSNTGSIAVATINLAQIGFLAKTSEQFFDRLNLILESSKKYLLWRKNRAIWCFENGLMPVSRQYIRSLDTFFLTIGIIGLNEASLNLFGSDIVENAEWCEYVVKYVREKTFEMQKETGHLFNFEATPAEGASYRLARIDRSRFGDYIITQGTPESPYYTNSSMIPANHELNHDIISVIRHQEKMQRHYTGGTIFHIFTGDEPADSGAIRELIHRVCEKTVLPYVSYTPIFAICPEHGQQYGSSSTCQTCGKECDVYSRVVGYYRPVRKWNDGKKQEFNDRINFKLR